MRAAIALVSALGGCSFIGYGNTPDQPVDAVVIDRDAPQQITLSQSHSTVFDGLGWSCNNSASQYTRGNRYYRVFDLAAAGVSRPLHVSLVRFGIARAQAGSAAVGQPLTVRIGTFSGPHDGDTLDDGAFTEVAHTDVTIADGLNKTIETVIAGDFAPTALLAVAIEIPDGVAAENTIFLGTNAGGETGHSFWRADACSQGTPIWMDKYATDHSLAKAELVLQVSGAY